MEFSKVDYYCILFRSSIDILFYYIEFVASRLFTVFSTRSWQLHSCGPFFFSRKTLEISTICSLPFNLSSVSFYTSIIYCFTIFLPNHGPNLDKYFSFVAFFHCFFFSFYIIELYLFVDCSSSMLFRY